MAASASLHRHPKTTTPHVEQRQPTSTSQGWFDDRNTHDDVLPAARLTAENTSTSPFVAHEPVVTVPYRIAGKPEEIMKSSGQRNGVRQYKKSALPRRQWTPELHEHFVDTGFLLEVVLLNTGNLVLRERSNPPNIIWQSFDDPTDPWLPGAKLDYNKLTGKSLQKLTSWRNGEDPKPRLFSVMAEE
nr:S-receptor-like serine/threonine-protein kinase [Ipomoea batatas]